MLTQQLGHTDNMRPETKLDISVQKNNDTLARNNIRNSSKISKPLQETRTLGLISQSITIECDKRLSHVKDLDFVEALVRANIAPFKKSTAFAFGPAASG